MPDTLGTATPDLPPTQAVPPDEASERDALAREIARIAPTLWKLDATATLSSLLKVIARARALGADGFVTLKAFANDLRRNRAFDDLYVITTEMTTAGLMDLDVERWRIQSLIEMAVYEPALELARPLANDGPETDRGKDGLSAMGRIYKQMYMDAAAGKLPADPETMSLYLERAFDAYIKVWSAKPSADTAYYGVNALAIGCRAEADNVTQAGEGAAKLAKDLLDVTASPKNAWGFATRGEALIALGRYDEAARAYAEFALKPEVDLFQLNAALRQLEEVWKLKGDDPARGAPVRLLKAAILAKVSAPSGGDVTLSAQVSISPREADLIRQEFATRQKGEAIGRVADPKGFEQIFEANAPLALQVVRNAIERSSAICRIHATMGGRDTPFATGFAIAGNLLNDKWGPEPVIVTNNHVISSQPGRVSQRAEYCEAVFFHADDADPKKDREDRIGFERILWESEQDAHDITILKLKSRPPAYVKPLSDLTRQSLPPRAEDDEGIGRVYVIGFPAAGELSFSFADNILLDHDAPQGCSIIADEAGVRRVTGVQPEPVRLHYKTPTLGGNSGSPVFDGADFSLLGVHHRGLPNFPKLNGRPGTYSANEGVWIESIRAAISESEADDTEAATSGLPKRWRRMPTAIAPAVAAAAAAAAAPILAAPLAGGAAATAVRFFPGAAGDISGGASAVAPQVLKSGKATAEEVAAACNESVVGIDDRTRIFETSLSPWRMLCALRCWWGSRLAVGTGFLVSPSLLLTAGHVVFPKDLRALPDRIEVLPGLNGAERPFGAIDVAAVSVHPGWQTSFGITSDVAAIHLTQPIGHRVGWFGVAQKTPDELRSTWSHVTGYPGEKQDQGVDPATGAALPPAHASQLWHHSAPIINVQNNRIFYATDTTPGQSGAPIYILDRAVSPTPVVIGVHAYGRASTPVAIGNANSGAWIDEALFAQIAVWRAESERLLKPGAGV
jgi:V8-like Glu-specific endopeptidase/tetratricopeptide (TPR) repeat protein